MEWPTCSVCFDTFDSPRPQTHRCRTVVCDACLSDTLREAIIGGSGKGLQPQFDHCFICPMARCAARMTIVEVESYLDPVTAQRLHTTLLRRALDSAPDFQSCPSPGCAYGVFRDDAPRDCAVDCPLCAETCPWCQEPAHLTPCKVQRSAQLAEFWTRVRITLSPAYRTCPRCSVPIQKNGGCRHMTCTACRHE